MAIPRNLANLANQLNTDGEVPKIEVGNSSVEVTDTGSNGTITFDTDGSERMRIDSSGNVGINSTSPGTYGDDNGGRNLVIQSTGAGRGVFTFASQVTGGANELIGRINFIDSDSTNTNYRGAQIDGLLGSDANSAYLRFNTANSGAPLERVRITQGGTVLIGTTSTTANGGVLQVSNGITFPATQSACSDVNTLDDYEEGTWTPAIGGTATYNVQEGYYTKIGNIVYVYGRIVINNKGTGNNFTMTGFPFSSNYNIRLDVQYFLNLATNVVYLSAIGSGATQVDFYSATAAASGLGQNTVFGNSATISFNGWYSV